MPNAIWYEAMIPGVATSMAATTAEVITATGIFCIAMKYVRVNIKTIHEYHFWDPGLMARLAQLRKFSIIYRCSIQDFAEFRNFDICTGR